MDKKKPMEQPTIIEFTGTFDVYGKEHSSRGVWMFV